MDTTIEEMQKKADILYKELKDPNTPQGKIAELNEKHIDIKRKIERAKCEEFVKTQRVSIYSSGDYIGSNSGNLTFYFGYEATKCPIKSHKTNDDCYEADCGKREWLFQAMRNNEVIFEIPESEIIYSKDNSLETIFILGIMHFLKQYK